MERTRPEYRPLSAQARGMVACTRCTYVWPAKTKICARCGARLIARRDPKLSRVWAWWVIALMCYIPANIYPMLRTRTLLSTQEDTIIGGAVELAKYGSYGVALIILIASVAIPVMKFAAIAFLAIGIKRSSKDTTLRDFHRRMHLYEIVEYIGRWSMIDVFVVAVLSSLVQLSVLASIQPGPASLFFALSVIFTMFSAQSFDPRLIWDKSPVQSNHPFSDQIQEPTE